MRNPRALQALMTAALLFVSTLFFGQNAIVPDIVPSANATAMGKYGFFPVSHYTGQANISIPVANIEANGVEMNFGLQYDGSGIMVDQHPGWVGQNWTLNGGGVITRSVNGSADEEGLTTGPDYYNNRISYISTVINLPSLITESNTDTEAELRQLALDRSFLFGKPIDTEADIFNFNFMGYTGKFFLGNDGTWKVISDDNLKIEFDYTDMANYQDPFIVDIPGTLGSRKYEKVIKGFVVKDDKGFSYTFGFDNNAIEYAIPFFKQYSGLPFFNWPNWIANAWYLTKIEDYNGNTIFSLDYERDYFTAQLNETYSSISSECKLTNGDWVFSGSSSTAHGSGSLISPVYLTEVTNNRTDKIKFIRSNTTQKKPLLNLMAIEISRINQVICPGGGCGLAPLPFLQTSGYYSFDDVAAQIEPIDGLMWQKLDSVLVYQNSNHLVKGINLQYNNLSSERLNLLGVDLLATDFNTNVLHEKYGYVMDYDQFNLLPNYYSNKTDHFGYYNNTTAYIAPDVYNYSLWQANYSPTRESNETFAKLGQLIRITYPTGGKSEFEYELHDYHHIVSNDRQSTSIDNGYIGGLRIKSVNHFDAIQTTPSQSSTYHYVSGYNTGGSTSSGILAYNPNYVWINWLVGTDYHPAGGYRESSWSNNLSLPLNNKFESHIGYSEVTEVNLDSSYNTHTFFTHMDIKDEIPYGNLNLVFSPYARFSDKSHMRGKTTLVRSYNATDSEVLSVENYYNNTILGTDYAVTTDAGWGYSCIQNNDDKYYRGNAVKLFINKHLKDSTTTTFHYGVDQLANTEIFQYTRPTYFGNRYAFLSEKSNTNSDGKVYKDYFQHSFNHTSSYSGQQAILTSLANSHRFPVVYTEMEVNGTMVDGSQSLYEGFGATLMPKYQLRYEGTWSNGIFTAIWDTLQTTNAYDLSFLKPTEILNKSWLSETITLNTRGYPITWQYLNYNRSYAYYPNDFLQLYTDLDGQYSEYEYDLFLRLNKSTLQPKNVENSYDYHYSTSPSDRSFFKSKIKFPLAMGSAIDSLVSYAYLDGLGREIQTINKYGSPIGDDVLSKLTYDNMGRMNKRYDLIPVTGNNGNYYTGAFSTVFSEQLYYADPLNRISQTTPFDWQPTDYTYATNTSPLTHPDGQVYPSLSLMINTTTDPDGKSTDIFTDKIGRTILQRQRQASDVTDTWTAYDDKGRITKIYPPESSPTTPELIFEYRYDGDDNLIFKKMPDATAEEYRYSTRNLLIAMRNPVLTAQGKWLVTHYDVYGRPTKRGYFSGSDPGTNENPTIATLLEEYFYDGFDGSTTNLAPIYKGKLRKSRLKVLEDSGANSQWVETLYSYDNYGRISTENIVNHLMDTEIRTYTYDFADNVTKQTHFISGSNGTSQTMSYTYDHQGRKIYDKLLPPSGVEKTISEHHYDHKNQVIENNIGRFATTGSHQYLQSLDYTYNSQGWITGINTLSNYLLVCCEDPCYGEPESLNTPLNLEPITDPDQVDLFALGIDYNTTLGGSGVPANQNGNITALKWWHWNSGQTNQSYSFKYDHLNRVTLANHGEIIQGNHQLLYQYNEEFEYDARGNITHLDRKGMVQRPDLDYACYKVATIDDLNYTYAPGTNKLIQVVDEAPCPDTLTLPVDIDRDAHYAANQVIYSDSTTVDCEVDLKLTASFNFTVQKSFHIPDTCGTPAYVQNIKGPCPTDKYTEGFNQQSVNGQYTYDSAGNMTFDPNKKLTFYYNHYNLPYRITGDQNDELNLLYSADGTLLQRKYIKNNTEISKRDYLRGIEYNNDILESVYHSEGRVITSGSNWKYEYHIRDHLGNVRVTFVDEDNDGLITEQEVRSRNDYYSFGMEWNGILAQNDTISPKNNYTYNSKEMVEEMSLKHLYYGARNYDPVIGRFMNIDPLSDQFAGWNPYHYVHNNPLRLTDPTGMKPDSTRIYNTGGEYKFTINDNLPNEDHFLTNKNINDLNGQCCNDLNQEGVYARSISEFHIGTETRNQLKEITTLSNSIGKEQGFVLTIGSERQLKVTNISKYADVSSSQIKDMNFAIEKSGIKGVVGAGHTHPNAKNEGPTPFPSSPLFGRMSDYSPHMYNPYNRNTYGGYLSIVSARNGFSIYQNGSVPNSYTFNPKTYSTIPAILQSFNGNKF